MHQQFARDEIDHHQLICVHPNAFIAYCYVCDDSYRMKIVK